VNGLLRVCRVARVEIILGRDALLYLAVAGAVVTLARYGLANAVIRGGVPLKGEARKAGVIPQPSRH
jgi:hypothetical protein